MHNASAGHPANPSAPGLATWLRGYSLEITSKDAGGLGRVAHLVEPGTRISVTSLPKEDDDRQLIAVREVVRAGFTPVPHISARRLTSRDSLARLLASLAELGAVEEIFVIAGDLAAPAGPYDDALAVIDSGVLESSGVRHVGIAGYPDGHPKIADSLVWRALRDKLSALTAHGLQASIVTQFGFDPAPVDAWLDRLREDGVATPVRLGIPGPASAAALIRFAARCGVSASSRVLARYGLSLSRLMQPAGPETYVRALADSPAVKAYGLVSSHFYPFGGLDATALWIAQHQ